MPKANSLTTVLLPANVINLRSKYRSELFHGQTFSNFQVLPIRADPIVRMPFRHSLHLHLLHEAVEPLHADHATLHPLHDAGIHHPVYQSVCFDWKLFPQALQNFSLHRFNITIVKHPTLIMS